MCNYSRNIRKATTQNANLGGNDMGPGLTQAGTNL